MEEQLSLLLPKAPWDSRGEPARRLHLAGDDGEDIKQPLSTNSHIHLCCLNRRCPQSCHICVWTDSPLWSQRSWGVRIYHRGRAIIRSWVSRRSLYRNFPNCLRRFPFNGDEEDGGGHFSLSLVLLFLQRWQSTVSGIHRGDWGGINCISSSVCREHGQEKKIKKMCVCLRL